MKPKIEGWSELPGSSKPLDFLGEPKALLGLHRDELKPAVRDYADNLHAQILGIYQKYGAKNSQDFMAIASTGAVPNETLEHLLNLTNKLVSVVEKGELPEGEVSDLERDLKLQEQYESQVELLKTTGLL